jgi:hypothetical protein
MNGQIKELEQTIEELSNHGGSSNKFHQVRSLRKGSDRSPRKGSKYKDRNICYSNDEAAISVEVRCTADGSDGEAGCVRRVLTEDEARRNLKELSARRNLCTGVADTLELVSIGSYDVGAIEIGEK